MKKYKVYAENIEKLYIVVEAENITDAYLQATKLTQSSFSPSFEVDQWHVLANNIIEIPTFPAWIIEHHSKRFSADLVDAMEDTDLQDDYLNFYGLSERDMV
jgi:hypothetical protein